MFGYLGVYQPDINGDCPKNTQICPYSQITELKNMICIKVDENISSEE
jgi:hypothetical protein